MMDRFINLTAADKEALVKSVPLGRFIDKQEVVDVFHFLCSASAKNITGQGIVIDGGLLA